MATTVTANENPRKKELGFADTEIATPENCPATHQLTTFRIANIVVTREWSLDDDDDDDDFIEFPIIPQYTAEQQKIIDQVDFFVASKIADRKVR